MREHANRGLRVWATERGAAFIDRELYVPRSLTDDPDRCAAAGLPDGLVVATQPALALGLITRTVAAGFRPDAAAGDEVYGNDPDLRDGLEPLGLGYVLVVSRSLRVDIGPASISADALAVALPDASWQIRSAGAGARGPRWYRWAYLHLQERSASGRQRYLLIRRNRATGELAFYRCWAPHRSRWRRW